MRLWVSLWGLLWGAGCAAGSMPLAVSQRPLTVPKGEHQIAAEVGIKRRVPPRFITRNSAIGGGVYRYGLTDHLEVMVPPGLGYRIDSGPAQLRLTGAFVGVGSYWHGGDWPEDPREHSRWVKRLQFDTEFEALSRLRWGPTRSVDVGFLLRLQTALAVQVWVTWFVSLGWTEEIGDWVSVGLGLRLGHEPRLYSNPAVTMGVALPLQVHLTDWLDVTARLEYDGQPLQKGTVTYSGGLASGFGFADNFLRVTGGLDVRFK